jgi:hypothetical protein
VAFEDVQTPQHCRIDDVDLAHHRVVTTGAQGRVGAQVEQGVERWQLAVPGMAGALDQGVVALPVTQGAVDKNLLATM